MVARMTAVQNVSPVRLFLVENTVLVPQRTAVCLRF